MCVAVHGHDRSGELLDAIREGSARVVEHGGRITGYTTGIAFFAHSVGETNEDLKALIAAAPEFAGPASCCRPATPSSTAGASLTGSASCR